MRRNGVRAVAVLGATMLLLAVSAGGATPAQAKVRCKPWGQIYDIGKKFYFVGGIRCSKSIRRLVTDGFIRVKGDGIGETRLFPFNASCSKKRVCLANSPDYPNAAGRQTMTVVFTTRFKEHWYSPATFSAGFKRTYVR